MKAIPAREIMDFLASKGVKPIEDEPAPPPKEEKPKEKK